MGEFIREHEHAYTNMVVLQYIYITVTGLLCRKYSD